MTELNAEIAPQVLAACQAAVGEMAEALGRALDGEFQVEPGAVAALDREELAEGLAGAGLVLGLHFGQVGAVLMLPAASGFLPAWLDHPGPTEQSKLETLAQELGILAVPEDFSADRVEAGAVSDLGAALARGEPAENAVRIPITLRVAEQQAVMSLIWPVTRPAAILETDPQNEAEQQAQQSGTSVPDPENRARCVAVTTPGDPFAPLPNYARSLLKIEVPMSVRLASKKQRVAEIVELCPGTILTFDKTCDEMLDLCAGGCVIAFGEAVKVGENFGLRISSMTLPDERFRKVVPQSEKT